MKRLVSLLLFIFFIGIGTSATHAAGSMGFIEVQKVFREYGKTKQYQDKLSEKEKELKKLSEESQEKLAKARRDGKSSAEIEALTKKLEAQIEPKQKELMKLNEALTSEIQSDIVKAVKNVAKNLGVDMVFDQQVIITGGVDLTEMVIKDLNKK